MDGVIWLSTPEIDGEALDGCARNLGKPVFGVGYVHSHDSSNIRPPLSRSVWEQDYIATTATSEEEDSIMTFLDRAEEDYGPNSAAYIR